MNTYEKNKIISRFVDAMLDHGSENNLVDGINYLNNVDIIQIYEHYNVEEMSIDTVEQIINDSICYSRLQTDVNLPLQITIDIPMNIIEYLREYEKGISDEKIKEIYTEFLEYSYGEYYECGDEFDIFIENNKDDYFD